VKPKTDAPFFWLMIALAIVAACSPTPPPATTSSGPTSVSASASTGTGSSGCSALCAHASALGCAWAKPTELGTTCESVCENRQTFPSPHDLACRTAASSCAAVDACP